MAFGIVFRILIFEVLGGEWFRGGESVVFVLLVWRCSKLSFIDKVGGWRVEVFSSRVLGICVVV